MGLVLADSKLSAIPQSLDGVIFDMDGVLADSEPFICEADIRLFREAHYLPVRPEDFYEAGFVKGG